MMLTLLQAVVGLVLDAEGRVHLVVDLGGADRQLHLQVEAADVQASPVVFTGGTPSVHCAEPDATGGCGRWNLTASAVVLGPLAWPPRVSFWATAAPTSLALASWDATQGRAVLQEYPSAALAAGLAIDSAACASPLECAECASGPIPTPASAARHPRLTRVPHQAQPVRAGTGPRGSASGTPPAPRGVRSTRQ